MINSCGAARHPQGLLSVTLCSCKERQIDTIKQGPVLLSIQLSAMRFFFSLVVPALLTAAHVASAQEYDSFNPPPSDIVARDVVPASQARSNVVRPYIDGAEEPSAQRRWKPKKAYAGT
jgi:hypothetical protein